MTAIGRTLTYIAQFACLVLGPAAGLMGVIASLDDRVVAGEGHRGCGPTGR